MSDLNDLIAHARIKTLDGEIVGEAVGFQVVLGKMSIIVSLFDDDFDDGDDPEKEDIPEETIHDKIRAISGGNGAGK